MAKSTCSIDVCEKPSSSSHGWCKKHYTRWKRHGDPLATLRPRMDGPCAIDECKDPLYARDWCHKHYERWRKHGDPTSTLQGGPKPKPMTQLTCKVIENGERCCEPARAKRLRLCGKHYGRWLRHGDPLKGARNPLPDICKIESCGRSAKHADGGTRGWCGSHYDRWVRWGDPLGAAPSRPVMRELTEAEAAWIAGIYEGEGCLQRNLTRNGNSESICWQLKIAMSDFDVIDRLASLAGIGSVQKETVPRIPGRKLMARWCVSSRADVLAVVQAIRPWLGHRREARADEFLAFITELAEAV